MKNRSRHALSVVVLIAVLGGCDSSGGDDIVVAGDEGCSYGGPTTLDAGPVTVALHLTSLGHKELSVARLEEGHTYPELETYLEQARDPITERPTWVTEIVTLELEHDAGEREGVSEDIDLPEGTYALICVDHQGFAGAGPTAKAIAAISVASP
jgi:hypothetical protein